MRLRNAGNACVFIQDRGTARLVVLAPIRSDSVRQLPGGTRVRVFMQRPLMHVGQEGCLAERHSGIAIGCEVLDLLQLPSQLPRSAMLTPSLKTLTRQNHVKEQSDPDA